MDNIGFDVLNFVLANKWWFIACVPIGIAVFVVKTLNR
jgi:hypothetical protein